MVLMVSSCILAALLGFGFLSDGALKVNKSPG